MKQWTLLRLYLLLVAINYLSVQGYVIGIDLGTSYSCVGVFKNGRVEIITNDQGNRITPSVVAFTDDGERLVGETAKNQAILNPENTVFEIKRLMGRRWEEDSVQKDIGRFPFSVIKTENGGTGVKIKTKAFTKTFSPEEISAAILTNMKKIAETFFGESVTKAVITVPAYFNDAQRKATKDAGLIAGLEVLRIVNEPTAAAIAHGYGRLESGPSEILTNLLVYDLGGGTFDVTILKQKGSNFETLSTDGDTHFGGVDFDDNLVEYLVDIYNNENIERGFFCSHKTPLRIGDKDIKKKGAIQRIKIEAEKTKKALSSASLMRIDLPSLYDGNDFTEKLSRQTFEKINANLFKKTITFIEKILKDSNLKPSDIHDILLVGGSTKIPKIRSLVKTFFENKNPVQNLNPDESVAVGAAILGAQLGGDEEIESFQLSDVIPHSLGVNSCFTSIVYTNEDGCRPDTLSIIIPRNTPVHEANKAHRYMTLRNLQETMSFTVYEGEDMTASNNHKLGDFDLNNIRKAPKKEVTAEVTFKVDSDGILHITAKEVGRDNKEEITITSYTNRLSKIQIIKSMVSNEEFKNFNTEEPEEIIMEEEIEIKRQEEKESFFKLTNWIDASLLEYAKDVGKQALQIGTMELLKIIIKSSIDRLNKNPAASRVDIQNEKEKVYKFVKEKL